MQKTIYLCDLCRKEVGEDENALPYLEIYSGTGDPCEEVELCEDCLFKIRELIASLKKLE
jgi:hypothetical protein